MVISGWANRAFGVAITRSPKAASSAPPPMAGPFTTHKNRLGSFQNARENGMECIQHLKDTLRSVFADIDAAAKNLAGGIQHDEFDSARSATKRYRRPFREAWSSFSRLCSGRFRVIRATPHSIRA